MGDNPRVSIIIPVHNREDLLVETLESVCAQTFDDWECIVVDDHSTDGSLALAERYAKEDSRFRAFALPPAKRLANAARNMGASVSTGEYVVFLDSDDLLAPYCLEIRVKTLQEHPAWDFAVFVGKLFRWQPDDTDQLYNVESEVNDLDRFLNSSNPWITLHPIWTRAALHRVGPWDESLPSWQDWDFHVRALIKGLKYGSYAYPDSYYRIADPERHSINIDSQQNTASHLPTYELVLRKTHDLLFEAGLLNDERRRLLVRRYYNKIIRRWRRLGNRSEASRVWAVCYRSGLISKNLLIQGRVLLTLERLRGLSRISIWLMRRWAERNGFAQEARPA